MVLTNFSFRLNFASKIRSTLTNTEQKKINRQTQRSGLSQSPNGQRQPKKLLTKLTNYVVTAQFEPGPEDRQNTHFVSTRNRDNSPVPYNARTQSEADLRKHI